MPFGDIRKVVGSAQQQGAIAEGKIRLEQKFYKSLTFFTGQYFRAGEPAFDVEEQLARFISSRVPSESGMASCG